MSDIESDTDNIYEIFYKENINQINYYAFIFTCTHANKYFVLLNINSKIIFEAREI
jgi:hypothetical protein